MKIIILKVNIPKLHIPLKIKYLSSWMLEPKSFSSIKEEERSTKITCKLIVILIDFTVKELKK